MLKNWRDWYGVAEAYRAGWCAVKRSKWFGVTVTYKESINEVSEGEELAVLVPIDNFRQLCSHVAEELERRERELARSREEHKREIEELRQKARELLKKKKEKNEELSSRVAKLERTAEGLREAVARWKMKCSKPVQEQLPVPDAGVVEERFDGRRLTRIIRTDFPWDLPAEKAWELVPYEGAEGCKLREIRRRGKSAWLAVYSCRSEKPEE